MEDQRIVDLYWARSEQAIAETDAKYGGYCYSIAYNVLANREDAEESVSDTYMAAWNALPPQRPSILATFLGKITRNLSISRWRARSANKRGGGELVIALDELGECVASSQETETKFMEQEAVAAFNGFLQELPKEERMIFLRRYWCLDSVSMIADSFGFSQSKVKSMLHRTRKKLRDRFEKEGFV